MRTLTSNITDNAEALLGVLADASSSSDLYRHAMTGLGRELAARVAASVPDVTTRSVCIACTVEDADFLARGLVEGFEGSGIEPSAIKLVCFWNERVKPFGLDDYDIAPVIKEYREPIDVQQSVVIVVKSIISGACVVKTNLATLLNEATPERVIVAAPVMLRGADTKLASEFPAEMSKRFEYFTFAVDDEKDGSIVIPGIGGSVYERLDIPDKISYVPEIVRRRRSDLFHA